VHFMAELKPNRAVPGKKIDAPTPNASQSVLTGDPSVLYPVGIRTYQGKFLTVETFGDQLNANGVAFRSKQVWIIETNGSGKFAFKSHKGKYLTVDHKTISATATSKGDKQWFDLAYTNGLANIFSPANGTYLSLDSSGNVTVVASPSTEAELFEIIINVHPEICLITQKRYLAVLGTEVVSNRDTQFGRETLFIREEADNRGAYGIRASTGKYLCVDSSRKVVATQNNMSDPSAQFYFEFHGNNMAIKSVGAQLFVTTLGTGLQALRTSVSLKEIFIMIDSDPQVTIKANNGKYVAFQGANLITTTNKVTNNEIFILESDNDRWAFKTYQENHISVKSDGIVSVDAKKKTDSEYFTMEFYDGKTAIRAPNGKYLSAKPLGGVEVKPTEVGPKELFEVFLFNRPQLVLQTNQQSFIGTQDDKVRTNKTKGEALVVEFKDSKYALRNSTGKYFKVGSDAKVGLAGDPSWFFFEFYSGRVAIKTETGKYLRSENQGWLVAVADRPEATELYNW